MKSVEALSEGVRARGGKVTPQRERIFRYLAEHGDHPTAEAVYAAVVADMPTISLRTVYQTLNDLVAGGELHLLDVGGAVRFDTTVDPHHHLVCSACGRIVDVPADFPEVRIPASLEPEFRVDATEIVFRGTCSACTGVEARAV